MFRPTRLLAIAVLALFAIAVACGGSVDPKSEEGVRADVQRFVDAAFGDEPNAEVIAEHFPNECQQDASEILFGLALAQAFFGDIEIEVEVTDVEFIEDDQAIVSMTTTAEIGSLFGADDAGEEARTLWVPPGRALAHGRRLRRLC